MQQEMLLLMLEWKKTLVLIAFYGPSLPAPGSWLDNWEGYSHLLVPGDSLL